MCKGFRKDKEMKNKIKLGKITYINAAPVYYGIDSDKILKQELKDFELIAKPPATLNSMIKKKEVDISPISSVAFAKMYEDLTLLPNFSISSFGEVLSVLLISKYELSELTDKKVFITNESETAKSLLKLICFENSISPHFEVKKNSELLSQDADAVLIIGDMALKDEWDNKKFNYTYDLGEMWYSKTKLPFVFAVWAVRKEFAQNSKDKALKAFNILNESREIGLSDIETIISKASDKIGISKELCRKYYKVLNCFLTPEHIESLKLFFGKLYNAGIIEKKAEISFLKF